MDKRDRLAPKIIGNRWVLGPPAGKGGMSEVFRATDSEHEHGQVALKLLTPPYQDNPWAVKAFEQEVQARLAPLDHPHIVPLLEHGRDPNTRELYLVFPWSGDPLNKLLRERGAIPWDDWWRFFGRPILDALAHAHRRSVAHRDLKPENVLVEEGIPRLADFGVAKLLGQLKHGLTLAAHVSEPFSPPEPDRGMHTPTRDLHAWAALTSFAVSGADHGKAAVADDPYSMLDQAFRTARERMPQEVVAAVARCLAEPTERPIDGTVLLAELDDILSTAPPASDSAVGTVHLRIPAAIEEKMEEMFDVYSAGARDLLVNNLSADPVVLPIPNREGHYRILGSDLSIHAAISSDGRCLRMVNVIRRPDFLMELERERGWRPPLRFTLEQVKDPGAADGVSVLVEGVADHRDEQKARERERLRLRPLTKWRGVLGVLRDLQDEIADPRSYGDVRQSRNSGSLIFNLDQRPQPAELRGQQRIAPSMRGPSVTGEIVGINGHEVVLKPDSESSRYPVVSGELSVDTRAARSSLRRQDTALDDVLYGRAQRRGLAELLSQPGSAREAHPVREPIPKQELDGDKRKALHVFMGEPDLLLIKGPPGTGKTRLIAEIVYQQLHADPDSRVLLASQTHSAIDNALLRIRDLDPTLRMLRVARADEERVDDRASDLRLDAQLDQWRAEAEQSGWAMLKKWAQAAGVNLEAVCAAVDLDALGSTVERVAQLSKKIAQLQGRIDNSRSAVERQSTAADLRDLRLEMRGVETDGRDQLSDLAQRGHLGIDLRFGDLDPLQLRQQAAMLMPDGEQEGRFCSLVRLVRSWHQRFGIAAEFEAAALARAQLVGATCVGLGAITNLRDVRFDLCIVDEASRATAPELLIPMARAERFVLVGDERQLPPHLDRDLRREELLQPRGLTIEEISEPFFSHLATNLPKSNVIELRTQHRMHPSIGRLIGAVFYDDKLTSSRKETLLPVELSTIAPKPVTWITTANLPNRYEVRQGESISNPCEAAVVENLLARLAKAARRREGPVEVAVLSGYRAQCRLLESRIASADLGDALALRVGTIDSFQGQEAEVVIYSVTRANPKGKLGFVRERPRVNVALSRGREMILIVGDHLSVRQRGGANPMTQVIDHIESNPVDCCLQEALA